MRIQVFFYTGGRFMYTMRNILRRSSLMFVLLAVIAPSAFAQTSGGGGLEMSPPSGAGRGIVKLRGLIVCAGCSLDETKAAHPEFHNLYEFRYEQGSVVLEVSTVNDADVGGSISDQGVNDRWAHIAQPPQLALRAEDSVYKQLTDPANQMKAVELTGLLHPTRTLDIQNITILG
jgi:hypothetical protein